ncbi:MAG TPA: NADPH-dependent FMN reductase [Verrucomicrobiae bacterium]|jgi:chromate reductase|nr:NADPH-dependent FMN reductase [Verrucomicrobiae bacterium]
MAGENLRVLGFAGSLRRQSYNRGLLRAAVEAAPAGVAIETFDLTPIPLYNADVEEKGLPPAVAQFKEKIRAADALLIVTPEYNYSVPGVLKNAIDWASRPANESPLQKKPAALMGASGGQMGTARAQLALRQSFVFTETLVLPKPDIYVPHAAKSFDAEGNLTDEKLRARIKTLLEALVRWVVLLRQGPAL